MSTVQIKGDETPPADSLASRLNGALHDILESSWLVVLCAVILAVLGGSILIAVTDPDVIAASAYFFSRPGDTFVAIWEAVSGAYVAFFNGAIYNLKRPEFATGIKPITETLTFATPLIMAGLGVGLTFRAGLFNIGGRGQMLFGAAFGGWVAFAIPLPPGVHAAVAILIGMLAGALFASIAGVLKAYTGAHEVIVTIMLNYIAGALIVFMLTTQGLLQAPGQQNPKSPPTMATAILPKLFGDQYRLHLGFILAIIATIAVWWILERSSLGFKLRAVGLNPSAAKTAGINVKRIIITAMAISGALVGLAGVNQVIGTETSGFSSGVDAGIGFDAITVALLGKSTPWGIFAAGILFGAFKAGGYTMQGAEGIQIDIVAVVQSLIVLFIAAPPLVRAIFRLPAPGSKRRQKKAKDDIDSTTEAVSA